MWGSALALPAEPLGSDCHDWWLGGQTGSVLRRGFEKPISQGHHRAGREWRAQVAPRSAQPDPLSKGAPS